MFLFTTFQPLETKYSQVFISRGTFFNFIHSIYNTQIWDILHKIILEILGKCFFSYTLDNKKKVDFNICEFSPWVILNDLGGAFVMGAVGGGIWHSVKGAKNSPRVCS